MFPVNSQSSDTPIIKLNTNENPYPPVTRRDRGAAGNCLANRCGAILTPTLTSFGKQSVPRFGCADGLGHCGQW